MRRTLLFLPGMVLLGVILACGLASPQPQAPAPDLIATQVASVLTQTALAAPQNPMPTATRTVPPPTPLPPSVTPRVVTPPYDGPCTPALTAPSTVVPDPNDPASFVGYRFGGSLNNAFPAYAQVPAFGVLLGRPTLGADVDGFAFSGYERHEAGILALFLKREVCRKADGDVYWEITDALAIPFPAVQGDFVMVAIHHFIMAPETINASNLSMGWYATLECSPPLSAQPVAVLRIALDTLPPAVSPGTRVPVTVNAAWMANPFTQRFEPLDPATLSCMLEFH